MKEYSYPYKKIPVFSEQNRDKVHVLADVESILEGCWLSQNQLYKANITAVKIPARNFMGFFFKLNVQYSRAVSSQGTSKKKRVGIPPARHQDLFQSCANLKGRLLCEFGQIEEQHIIQRTQAHLYQPPSDRYDTTDTLIA